MGLLAGSFVAAPVAVLVLLVASATIAAPASPPAPAAQEISTAPILPEPLPPPQAGRTVIADVPSTVLAMEATPGDAKALAAEDWALIAEINRSPSTWQTYLLYTQRDLPERLFHPGFTFVLDRPKKQPATVPATPSPAGSATPVGQAAPAEKR